MTCQALIAFFHRTSLLRHGYVGTQDDALKSYGGVNFTYNAYGYPTGYYNGSDYTFSWDKYGNLSGATKGSKTLSYGYDISGIRTSKAVSGGLTQTYYYDGDKLIGQVCSDGTAIMFNYGTDGEMFGFSRMVNGYQYDYYYVKNAQGDVLKVMNQNMDVVARYYYDAWGAVRQIQDGDGNIISDTTSQNCIANINPIRYRGYYYDIETGLYYLQTRYYDPEIGRFISRDSYEGIGANNDVGSYNLFAYCGNNPINRIDPDGRCWLIYQCGGDDPWECGKPVPPDSAGVLVECEISVNKLHEMGFANATVHDANELSMTLWLHDIDTFIEQAHFLAQCAAETNFGVWLTELGTSEYFEKMVMVKSIEVLDIYN